MHTTYLYFSPTGGTEKAAALIAKAIDSAAIPLDISCSTANFHLNFGKDDLCIIAVPSFGGRVPAVALARLQQMTADGAKAVLITAYGNRDYDDTLLELKETMLARGFCVIAAIAAVTEHSIVHQFGAHRPDAADAAVLRGYAAQIKEALAADVAFTDVKVKGNHPYREYHGIPMKPAADKACIRCGTCAKSCPVGAIPLANPTETDKDTCISCMRCIAVCPQHSRKLNPVMLFAVSKKLEKACATRKENECFFGFSSK
ncbi:MAG: 4Fe-4S binding protein [Ruthenibacterium sp.]